MKLLIDGQAIDEVQKTKFLGIIIDNKLEMAYCRQNFTLYRDDYKSKAILEQIWLNVSILFLYIPVSYLL